MTLSSCCPQMLTPAPRQQQRPLQMQMLPVHMAVLGSSRACARVPAKEGQRGRAAEALGRAQVWWLALEGQGEVWSRAQQQRECRHRRQRLQCRRRTQLQEKTQGGLLLPRVAARRATVAWRLR